MNHNDKETMCGLYRMPKTNQIIDITYAGVDEALGRDFYEKQVTVDKAALSKAKKLSPKELSAKEIWRLTQKINTNRNGKPLDGEILLFCRLCHHIEWLLKAGHLSFDCRGYFLNGTDSVSLETSLVSSLATIMAHRLEARETKAETIAWATDPTEETFRAIYDPSLLFTSSGAECPITSWIFRWEFNGVVFRPVERYVGRKDLTPEEKAESYKPYSDGTPCLIGRSTFRPLEDFPHKDGHLPRVEIELDCPSGKLLFANVLYDVFDEGPIHQGSVGTEAGRNQKAAHLATKGAWHLYNGGRGNVYSKNGKLIIGSFPEDQEDPAAENGWIANPNQPEKLGWKNHGNIGGGLWWFYGCDEATLPKNWKRRLSHKDIELVRVKVAPGRYKLTNHHEHGNTPQPILPGGNENISCTIELVAPVKHSKNKTK